MLDSQNAFVTPTFLRSVWTVEYDAFKDSPAEAALWDRLQRWAARDDLSETSAEPAFIEEFFRDTWGYLQSGQAQPGEGYSLWPKFTVAGAGAGGGQGKADLALGYFGAGQQAIPQVLCEYKDISTDLDAPQRRKGNTRSPEQQALDYLSHARRGMMGSEPILPTWAIVSDMNEFRLYWYDRGRQQHVDFVIRPRTLFQGSGMLAGTEAARFDRFLFSRLFHRDTLLTRNGRSMLLGLIQERRFRDRKIEGAFYKEYRALRDRLYTELLARNGEGTPRFPGTRGRLVRLAQKILDRLLFVFFCDDMGQRLAYPAKLLQTLLTNRANDQFFDPSEATVWQDLLRLFRAMNTGTPYGGRPMHKFNGGLFEPDPLLERLEVPNGLFCQHMQGQSEASIAMHPLTVLYLCATYNYAADLGEGGERDAKRSLGLYTLGRIFEQSITELEILEAEADGRPSVNKASQRKRDGVYYTPEWIVEKVVGGTLDPAFAGLRQDCGWDDAGEDLPDLPAVDAYLDRLHGFTVLDPACGSGAFLITALRHLAAEWKRTRATRALIAGRGANEESEGDLVSRLLRDNIHGIDINPASVEIAQLALWLHTARGDQPLSTLAGTVRCGNTLVDDGFYLGVQLGLYDEEAKDRVNAFDWRMAFPAVAARGGFDAVVGNPPYVKLQNFRPAYPDVAEYLVEDRPGQGHPYESTRTGNFDLYLPFIERGLSMLSPAGRLGYIAPSLWAVNDYGAGLRKLVAEGRNLDRWLDFKSFQVFEEATTYTALQYFSRAPTEAIRIAQAPRGVTPTDPWSEAEQQLGWGQEKFGDRWLLLGGVERALVDRLAATCHRLDDSAFTQAIFTGIQTSADDIYHLKRLGPGQYLRSPPSDPQQPHVPRPAPYQVKVEDGIMRPLVSGKEAKRYCEPQTDTYLLFPYENTGERMEIVRFPASHNKFPKAQAYLLSQKGPLEMREAKRGRDGVIRGPVYDELYYRYVYPKSLDKHSKPKLIVPRLVAHLGCIVDEQGTYYLDNVDVGGVLAADGVDPWFLAGILNAPVADWVFRRISKPFRGDYLSANKQFIAPLPIPPATAKQNAAVAAGARELQRLHTERRDLLARIARRLGTVARRPKPFSWLFAGLADPGTRDPRARAEHEADLDARCQALGSAFRPGAALDATLTDGELRFLVDDLPVLDRIFVTAAEGPFLLAQWKVLASTLEVTERTTGKKLAGLLRSFALSDNPAVVEQVLAAVALLAACEASISEQEAGLNDLTFRLYGLTAEERALVAAG